MSDSSGPPAAGDAASASSQAGASSAGGSKSAPATPRKPLPEQNPALKMMGLPRLRLPSRNWMIFLSITGSFAAAVAYDKWQTKRIREKWCNMVSHFADEPLDPKTLPRKVTIYLAAPPGDGLRSVREHFHLYVKPILVAAAMDWDVIEGRREGDVRHKTAEKIRNLRKKNSEGKPLSPEEAEKLFLIDNVREKNGETSYPGVAGDIVIGRHTWKEYMRGLHEGYLGPPDLPQEPEVEEPSPPPPAIHADGQASIGDAAVKVVPSIVTQPGTVEPEPTALGADPVVKVEQLVADGESEVVKRDHDAFDAEKRDEKSKEKEEEKPKRRFPPSPILPNEYQSAILAASTPEIIGPSVGVRFSHLLGFRNTPTRIYRFLNRRSLMDTVGRQVASAILAGHRPYSAVTAVDADSASQTTVDVPEQQEVLANEQRDWWKTVNDPRQEHEESVWIEPMVFDERITSRMRAFEMTADDEAKAKSIALGSGISTD